MPIGLQAANDLYLDHISAGECAHLRVLCFLACGQDVTSAHCCSCCWRHWTSPGGHASNFGLSEAHVVSPLEDVRGEWFARACLLVFQRCLCFVRVSPALLGHYTNKLSSPIGLTGKAHSVTVSIPTMILLLVQVRQICGCSIDKLIQNRGQLLVSN